jgi:trigger factor
MLQNVEDISPTTKRLEINVPSDVIQSESDSVYNHIRATANIPGFRPGKVPQSILVKKFGKNVEAQVIEKVVPEFYMKAVKEANLEPVGYPNLSEKIEITPGQPLSFSVTVEVKPILGDLSYGDIKLNKKTFTVENDEIDKAITLLQESKALYSVTDEPLKEDDMAIINSESYIDGQITEELSHKEFPYILGSEGMPREFTEALIGKKKGDSVEVKIKFEEDFQNKTIAGKEVLFKIEATETKKKNLPPLDDELAKEADCKNMDELKAKIKENLGKRKESQINLDYKKEILNELIKRHDFSVPDVMAKEELESLVDQVKQDAMRKNEIIKPDDELRKENEQIATDNVKGVIILDAIGKKENIEVTDDDMNSTMEEIAFRNNLKLEELKRLYSVREGSIDALKSRLFADKVLDFILEKATIED